MYIQVVYNNSFKQGATETELAADSTLSTTAACRWLSQWIQSGFEKQQRPPDN